MSQVRTPGARRVEVVGVEDWRFIVADEGGVVEELGLGWPAGAGRYFLDMAELTYIAYKGLAEVIVEGSPRDLATLYAMYPQMDYAWSKFAVLLDLRERGRKAKSGHSPKELLYTKGSQRVLVLVLEENTLVAASEIADWVRSAIMRGYTPVIAVVDAHGDVTYYAASLVRAKELARVLLDEASTGAS